MACDMLWTTGMTRHATDLSTRARSQRRILAAGVRMRGQWRYLVRSLHDPFTLGDEGADEPAAARVGSGRSTHRSVRAERA